MGDPTVRFLSFFQDMIVIGYRSVENYCRVAKIGPSWFFTDNGKNFAIFQNGYFLTFGYVILTVMTREDRI